MSSCEWLTKYWWDLSCLHAMVRLDKPLASEMAAVVRQIYRRCWALRLLAREARGESDGMIGLRDGVDSDSCMAEGQVEEGHAWG